jgi:hypothetical protein
MWKTCFMREASTSHMRPYALAFSFAELLGWNRFGPIFATNIKCFIEADYAACCDSFTAEFELISNSATRLSNSPGN